jgi:hypothetical protein
MDDGEISLDFIFRTGIATSIMIPSILYMKALEQASKIDRRLINFKNSKDFKRRINR